MLQRLRRSEAPRRFLAVVMAYLTVLGTMPAYANSSLSRTATPIKHLVVIFQENVSFDHYFGTYPNAANPQGEPAFYARPDTPTVNGLAGALLNNNPNLLNAGNGTGATNPFRLDRSQAATADQGTQLWTGAGRSALRLDGSLSAEGWHRRTAAQCSAADCSHQGSQPGLLRWQHSHRVMELCATLCHE